MPKFQVAGAKANDCKDHIWTEIGCDGWKCVLCGAVTKSPPKSPTPSDWMPERYELLYPNERGLEPYTNPYGIVR